LVAQQPIKKYFLEGVRFGIFKLYLYNERLLKNKNFRISLFPGYKIKGRKEKIAYNINENV
jgi:hypothetical protein